MPSIITHGSFGKDVYRRNEDLIGPSLDCYQAFILGNQGPDPLFYAVLTPKFRPYWNLGSLLHSEKPAEIFAALKDSLDVIAPDTRNVGEAYAMGFLCHYLLDSTAHPFIFAWEHAFCHAGIPGLTPVDHSEVHAAIETELDEVVLYTRTHKTIAEYKPREDLLACDSQVLDIIDQMMISLFVDVFQVAVPRHFYSTCVKSFRFGQGAFHSPRGVKRTALERIERVARPHSFCAAMSHKNVAREESPFENNDHLPWTHPSLGTKHTESFADLYLRAMRKTKEALPLFMDDAFGLEEARALTGNLDFSGDPYPRV